MPPVSTIEKLPQEVREALDEWLRDRTITQAEATRRTNAMLEELGLPQRITRGALNRYAARMTLVGEKMRQSREIAEAWIAKLGSAPGGKLAHLVTEMLRSLAFDIALQLENADLNSESLPGVINAATKVSLLAQRLERTSEMSARRERQLKREAAEDLAAKVSKKQDAGGAVRLEQIRQVIRDIYGVS